MNGSLLVFLTCVVSVPVQPETQTESEPIEVIQVDGQSISEALESGADAVSVVQLESARQRSADLGELLARTRGVGVQRSGGLGSEFRLLLGGLSDEQIRFSLDGIPLELAGFPFGLANVPVGLLERVEIYRGDQQQRHGSDSRCRCGLKTQRLAGTNCRRWWHCHLRSPDGFQNCQPDSARPQSQWLAFELPD
ncbi:MAG: TonB-dependent receptor plug domain-containing protein [Myxococcota bacterium]